MPAAGERDQWSDSNARRSGSSARGRRGCCWPVATVARPDTILGWYRKLAAHKFDGSKARQYPERPRIKREVEELIIRMARENLDWVSLLNIPSGHGIGEPMKATVADVR
jgi:hypothetical protein